MAKAKQKHPTDDILKELRAFGLAYPGAHFKSPWPGHMDLAVKDKTFAYLSLEGEPLGISCKLPRSSAMALMLPFCKPTEYGLGKSGWVSASFADADVDVAMLKAWIDESYRAQAPKKLVASLGAPESGIAAPAGKPAPTKRPTAKSPARRPPAKRAPAKRR
jgi:predicted DNA-binding protein (MmcQ/YjbR family)